MPSQRTFDGPDLEAALARVRDEVGNDALILGAERVRSGGLAGFFSRERYEITVELEDEGDEGMADAAAGSILELAERVNRSEQAAVSTQSPSFAAVLEGITAACGLGPAEPEAAGPEGEGSAESAVDGRRSTPPSGAAPAGPDFALDGPPAGPSLPAPAPHPAAAPSPWRGPWVEAAPVAPVVPAAVPALRATGPLASPDAGRSSLHARLGTLGLPDVLLAGLPAEARGADEVLPALMAAFADLPAPPPLPASGGAVVAVVGQRRHALRLARDLAHDLGVDAGGVVLASPAGRGKDVAARFHLSSADAAGDARRSWRRRPHATVVAVDASHRRQGAAWARHLLAALEPAATWGVIDAGRKIEDIAAWADRLGGLDALTVVGVEDTMTPAAVLALGMPVARLDRRRATPARWAALLTERLTA